MANDKLESMYDKVCEMHAILTGGSEPEKGIVVRFNLVERDVETIKKEKSQGKSIWRNVIPTIVSSVIGGVTVWLIILIVGGK